MNILKKFFLIICLASSAAYAQSPQGDNRNSSTETVEKLLDFKIDMTVLKNPNMGPGGPKGPPTGQAQKPEDKVDYTPGSNPASFDQKKAYRTAFPKKGQVGPFTKIYDNQTLLLTTYETYTGSGGEQELIDYGVHVGLGKPLSSKSDACNADKLDSRTTFFLFGKNGILGVIFHSKSLYNEPNNFDIVMNTGVYSTWKSVKSNEVFINCRADEDQWIFKGKVRLNDEVK